MHVHRETPWQKSCKSTLHSIIVVQGSKFIIPSTIKAQMLLGRLGRLGCLGTIEIFYNFAKILYFWEWSFEDGFFILAWAKTTDYGRPERKLPALHGHKFNPNPKFLGTAEAYFVCHIDPIIQMRIFDLCLHWVSVVCGQNKYKSRVFVRH